MEVDHFVIEKTSKGIERSLKETLIGLSAIFSKSYTVPPEIEEATKKYDNLVGASVAFNADVSRILSDIEKGKSDVGMKRPGKVKEAGPFLFSREVDTK